MGQKTRIPSEGQFQLGKLMILLVGLLSVCHPGHLKHAQVPHRAPVSSTRPHNRLRMGSRTSADAHAEPEIAGADGVLQHDTVQNQVAGHSTAAIVSPDRGLLEALHVCGSSPRAEDASPIASAAPLPRLGRAPPVVA
ncbi:hypothetical protein FTO74_01235 [Granulicella sp. WH15]|uniref:hypothetical protein n=1 Tax=Granulicella sp. WH15 TaxID=2602070 RepID=UPI0013671E2A|nr:hypothetical protein [Granulicella sp. WH15]QHN02156.1 hypothetical protein FTO74_01235 [Granulicella sp. WH15]